jgi:putative two-component system response regulator
VIKTHTGIGAEILGVGASDYINMGAIIALSHHEKWDGSGYPAGLSGRDIPLVGRICAVADVFDALTSTRPYKEAFSVDKSLEIMEQGRGTHFDPAVLDAFLNSMEKILEIRKKFGE